MTELKTPFSDIIPALSEEEYGLLEESILAEGVRDPLVVWGDILIDGHNRLEIATEHEIIYETINRDFETENDAKEWILKNQLGRRNLDAYTRGVIALEWKKIIAEKAKKNQVLGAEMTNTGLEISPKAVNTRQEIATIAGISDNTISKIEKIEFLGDEGLIQKIHDGEISINKAYIEVKRLAIKDKVQASLMPSGRYRIIYSDPPWTYGDKRDGRTTGAEDHYPCMTISELCALPIRDITEDDAVLFMWVTSPLLSECFAVISAWGFKYKTSFVWDKVKHNMGHYNSVRHELLLVCTKGSCLPDKKQLFDSVQSIERTNTHSEKPEEFRQIIETIYTHGKKIELFARNKIDGWDNYGNQL